MVTEIIINSSNREPRAPYPINGLSHEKAFRVEGRVKPSAKIAKNNINKHRVELDWVMRAKQGFQLGRETANLNEPSDESAKRKHSTNTQTKRGSKYKYWLFESYYSNHDGSATIHTREFTD